MKALSASPLNSRVYASSAYCIARYYYDTDQKDLYEKYIVEAAISDQICLLKENLALQEFSTYLYKRMPPMQRGLPNTSIAPWRMPNSTTTVSAW